MTAAGDVIVPLEGRFNACAASVRCRGSMTSEPLDLALSVANSRRAWLGAREVLSSPLFALTPKRPIGK
eukprot:scaffold17601_cov96-Isochrysis_galbana.AAC.1